MTSHKNFQMPVLEAWRMSTARTNHTTSQRASPEARINEEVFCG